MTLVSCASKEQLVRLDAEDQFAVAKRDFDKGKYSRAADGFRRLTFEHPGSARVDEAQFRLAMCYYKMKDYTQAEAEFRHLAVNYPDSPFADDAFFYTGMTHYRQMPAYYHDQSETHKAIDSFSRFLVRYPESEFSSMAKERIRECRDRLAHKELENGKLYLKLGVYESAVLYFQLVVLEYPDTRWSEEAKRLLNKWQDKIGSSESDTSQTKK